MASWRNAGWLSVCLRSTYGAMTGTSRGIGKKILCYQIVDYNPRTFPPECFSRVAHRRALSCDQGSAISAGMAGGYATRPPPRRHPGEMLNPAAPHLPVAGIRRREGISLSEGPGSRRRRVAPPPIRKAHFRFPAGERPAASAKHPPPAAGPPRPSRPCRLAGPSSPARSQRLPTKRRTMPPPGGHDRRPDHPLRHPRPSPPRPGRPVAGPPRGGRHFLRAGPWRAL